MGYQRADEHGRAARSHHMQCFHSRTVDDARSAIWIIRSILKRYIGYDPIATRSAMWRGQAVRPFARVRPPESDYRRYTLGDGSEAIGEVILSGIANNKKKSDQTYTTRRLYSRR